MSTGTKPNKLAHFATFNIIAFDIGFSPGSLVHSQVISSHNGTQDDILLPAILPI